MKKIKYFILLLLLFPFSVSADCTSSELARMRKLASNVTYSTSYDTAKSDDGEDISSFNITFTNLSEDLYIIDTSYFVRYRPTNGISKAEDYYGGQTYSFAVRSDRCGKTDLVSLYVDIPYFNYYYNQEICKGYSHLSVCQKWVKVFKTEEQIQNYIDNYKQEYEVTVEEKEDVKGIFDYLFEFVKEYYYIVVPVTIVILLIGILVYRNQSKKKSLF